MKLEQIKALYPDAESFYDAFTQSEFGKEIWEDAWRDHPEFNDGGEDMDNATDDILFGMREWISELGIDDSEDEDADVWFESMYDELAESIMAGLT